MQSIEVVGKLPKKPGDTFRARGEVYWDSALKLAFSTSRADRPFVGHAEIEAPQGTCDVNVVFAIAVRPSPPPFVTVPNPTTVTFTLPPGAKVTPIFKKPNASMLELKEFCYARTLIGEVDGLQNDAELIGATDLLRLIRNLRDLLRCHRFDVLIWLMIQGVDLPPNVIADETHPAVGDQCPDRSPTATPPAS